ncbi:hypothetical protein ACSSS7_004065 [Eimeria intestinalis]
MSAAVSRRICKTLFSNLRELYEEVQAAALAQGFLQSASAATHCATSPKHNAKASQSAFSPSRASFDLILSSARSCELDNPNSLAKKAGPATIAAKGFISFAAGFYVLGGALALGFGSSFALALIVVSLAAVLALAASWLVVCGLLEVAVLRCASRLRRLVGGLHLQQKVAREAVRWVQELEVTFKAIPVIPAVPQQRCSVIGQNARRDTKDDEQSSTPSKWKEAKHAVHPSASQGEGPLHPSHQSDSKNSCTAQLQGHASSRRSLVVGSLSSRLCQLLMWEEEVMCNIYEAIMRPTRGVQGSWRSLVSQGPWVCGRVCDSGNAEQNSVRALKDASARNWAVHSRLSAGLQVAVRRLLFLLDTRLHRGPAMLKQRRSFNLREWQPVFRDGNLAARSPSRTLRQALLMQRQQHIHNGNIEGRLSLGDEVAQATLTGCGSGVCADATVSSAARESRRKNASACAPLAYEGEHQRTSREYAHPHNRQDLAAPLRHDAGVKDPSRFPCFILEALCAFQAVVDGLTAAWWLQQQLSELSQAILAAAEVSEIATNALRTTLEEEWTICPLPSPQPPRVLGLSAPVQGHGANGGVANESFRLLRCSASPPPSSCQAFASLSGTLSPANRLALASMSRHIGASLALLRLPSMASSRVGSQKGSLSCPHRCKCSVLNDEASTDSKHQLEVRGDKGTTDASDSQLSTVLQLSLRHLRVACEEAERLQQSLRRPVQGFSVVFSQAPTGSEEPLKKVPLQNDTPTQRADAFQQTSAEPLPCLEVYTALGQDCSSNNRKYQEEAALLADFADEDPALRERSALILRELEVRLQTQQVELQSMPLVLKEFSGADFLAIDENDRSGADNEGVIRIVEGGRHAAAEPQASRGCKTGGIRDDLKAAVEHAAASSVMLRIRKGGTNHCLVHQNSEANKTVYPVSPQTDGGLARQTHNSLLSCMREEGCKEFVADSSLPLLEQTLCDPRKDLEAPAARSLISELQGLLADQRGSCNEDKHSHCFTSPAGRSAEVALARSYAGTDDGECVPSPNGHLIDEEEGESCELAGRESRSNCNSMR